MSTAFQDKIAESFKNLKTLKENDQQEEFRNQFTELVPDIKEYIKDSLESASQKEMLKSKGYEIDDFINELYIYVYENIEKNPKHHEPYIWFFEAVETLLQDTIIEEEYDNYFFDDIDKYSKIEWKTMEEEFSTDGDGDLMLLEEVDELTTLDHIHDYNYELKDVFIKDDEKDLIDKLEKYVTREKLTNHINMILKKLPYHTQRIYRLYTFRGLDIQEISHVMRIEEDKVIKIIENTQENIKKSFRVRFMDVLLEH